MATTTYMLLVLPEASVTTGPAWAQALIDALTAIDSHDHSADHGSKVTPSGLDINADLTFGNNNAKDVNSVRLSSQSAALASASDLGCVYRVGGNLYFNNANGAAVQITSGTSLAVSGTGAISASSPGAYPYTVVSGDAQKVLVIDTSAARALTLPAATTAMFFMIKDGSGQAQTNAITLTPNGTDLIDGVNAAVSLNSNYGSWGVVSDGVSKWYLV